MPQCLRSLLPDEFIVILPFYLFLFWCIFTRQFIYLLWIYATSRVEFGSIYVHRALRDAVKQTETFLGGISRMFYIFKMEVFVFLDLGLCSLPWEYYPTFGFLKVFAVTFLLLDVVCFLQNIRWLITSKLYICHRKVGGKIIFPFLMW